MTEAQVTRYGYSSDPYANENDRNAIGNRNNKLIQDVSVALSPELAELLSIDLKAGDFVIVHFPEGARVFRVDDSTAPGLVNYRVDFFDPGGKFTTYDGMIVPIEKAHQPN